MENYFDINKASRFIKLFKSKQIYHRAEIFGIENIPENGRAIIVSNHGRLDFDIFILIKLLWDNTSRFPRIMGDRLWFKNKIFRSIAHRTGVVEGNKSNAIELLHQDQIILTYPGGVREIMNSQFGKEHILWENRTGFSHVAIATKSPIIPIAGIGVNNGFFFISSGKWLGKLLYKWLLRMGSSYNDYRDPLTIGLPLFPLPYSTAVHFPFPCKVKYFVGKPIRSEFGAEAISNPEIVKQFAKRVENTMQDLLEQSK